MQTGGSVTDVTTTQFNFSDVDVAIREKVMERDMRFELVRNNIGTGYIELGKILKEQKEDLPHGQWETWLDSKGIGKTTAKSLIKIYLKFSNRHHGGVLGFKVMQLIAQDSTPDEAVEETIQRAKSGEEITVKKVKEIIEVYKEPDDYVKIKSEKVELNQKVTLLKKNVADLTAQLESLKSEMGEKSKLTLYTERIQELGRQLQRKEEELNKWDWARKEMDAVSLVSDAGKNIHKAFLLMTDPRGNGSYSELFIRMLKGVVNEANKALTTVGEQDIFDITTVN